MIIYGYSTIKSSENNQFIPVLTFQRENLGLIIQERKRKKKKKTISNVQSYTHSIYQQYPSFRKSKEQIRFINIPEKVL